MDKVLEFGKSSARGSFQLLIGVAGSTIIMAIGTFVLAALLDADQVGLYGMALIPSTIIGFFRDWGVNSALTQRIASLRASGDDHKVHDVIYSGMIFEIITGAILSVLCFAIAEPLAFLLSPENITSLTFYISILSFSIFGGALFAAASGIFVGFEKMALNSRTQIIQAFVKTALGPLLIVVGFGVLGAIYAAVVSIVAGGVMAALIVYFILFKPLPRAGVGRCDVRATLRPMLQYGLPLTVSTIIFGVLPQVFAFVMAIYAGTEMMGNYYVSTYFITLLSFIAIPVSTALFPVFSRLNTEKEPDAVKSVFAFSIKYMSVLLVPAVLLLMTLSTPAINLLFPKEGFLNGLLAIDPAPKYPYAPLFLSVSCLAYLLVTVGYFTTSSFQNGIQHTKQAMKQGIASLLVGLPLAFLLVVFLYSVGGPVYAVIGGILGNLIAIATSVLWGAHWCWRTFKVKADLKCSAKILASSMLAAVATYLFVSLLSLPYIFLLIGGVVVFLFVYLTVAPLVGAISITDIGNLRSMCSSFGFLSKIAQIPLLYMQKICRLSVKTTKQ